MERNTLSLSRRWPKREAVAVGWIKENVVMESNINDNAEVSASQAKRILAYMEDGNSITPMEALKKFSCFRLGARIADISAMIGRPVPRQRVKVRNADGKDVWVMQYHL